MPPVYGVCPDCGARYPLEAAIQDAEARRALAAALGLPEPVSRRVIAYLGLHAPRGRAMSWPKTTRLLESLAELIVAPTLTRGQGSARAIPVAVWAQALDESLAARAAGTLQLPLDGHGWLSEVAYRLAGRAEATGERQREARARGETPVGQHASHKTYTPERPRRVERTAETDGQLKSMKALLGRVPAGPGEGTDTTQKET